MKKSASILDYSYPFLDPAVWDHERKLYAYQKDFLLRLINTMYETYGLKQPETWVEDIVIIGSLTTSKWLFSSDMDVHIRVNLDAFIASNMPGSTREQAFEKLDLTRKEFDRAKILAPMTQHPIEFYFESIEFKPSNIALVGVYSILKDTWLKEPITFDADLDFEESKKDVVAQAEALAEELDSSLGKIRRNIQRVDELEAVINAWGKDKQQLFYSKVEQKLKSIEEEILKDLKIKQDLVDARHENQNATSEIEIKFKWLARFGFFGILSNLKTLLEQTGGQVTTLELPLIEKIISEGSIQKRADAIEISTTYSRGEFPVLIDPTEDEKLELIKKSQYDELRYLEGSNGNIYVWDAYRSTHAEVAQELHYRGFDVDVNSERGTISMDRGSTWPEEVEATGTIKEASSAIQDINGVRVYRNPTPEQAVNLFRQSKYHALRYIAIAYEDIYMWDASDIEHSQMAEDLGLTEDPDWYNGAGTLTTESNTRQKAEMFSRHSVASIKEAFLKEAFGSTKETDTQIAIDFDGTICKDKKFPDIGEPEEGVKEALSKIKDLGYDILIYTCRSKNEEDLEIVREWLDKHEIPYDSIFEGEKPFAKFYIDDRAIYFDGNWNNVLDKVEKSDKKASLCVVATSWPSAFWVDPSGKIYNAEPTHDEWVRENKQLLKDQYGIDVEKMFGNNIGLAAINYVISKGWTRVAVAIDGRNYIANVYNLRNVPTNVIDFLLTAPEGAGIVLEDKDSRNYVQVNKEDLLSGQKGINRAIQMQKGASLNKQAGYDHAYWLDPNGKLFQVRGEDNDAMRRELDLSDEKTHSSWVIRNLDMLQKDYGIDPKSITGTRSLVELGWTRIGDAYGTDWGIDVANTDNIPSFVDDTIAQFAPEGSQITVAGPGSSRYQHSQSAYTFEWPVKSIQQTVQQLKNRQSQKLSPELQQAAKLFSKRDIVAKTKKVKQGDYSCLMALVPHDLAQEIVEWGVRNIPDNVLYLDKDDE